jgi:predicted RNA polymerase sigma factor
MMRLSRLRTIRTIASRTGDVADAQDTLTEALVAALETWPINVTNHG